MKKFRITALVLAMILLVSGLVACGSSGTSAGTSPAAEPETAQTAQAPAEPAQSEAPSSGEGVIYGIYKAGDQTWFIDEGAAAQVAAEAKGDKFIYVDAKMSPEEYLKAIDNAIANNAKGIVTCIPDQTMSQAVADKCKEAGIPIVAADDAIQDESGGKLVPWVGINAYVIGEANGLWMANYAKDNNLVDDKESALLILTMDTVSSCVPRAEGIFDKFTSTLPEFSTDKIFYADYDGTTDKGNQVATAIITAHPEIKKWMIAGANEEGTIGAVRSLESAGLDKDSCVIGLGAYLAKDEWNNKGADGTCMKAAAYFSSDSVGAGSVNVLYDIIAGKQVPQETAVDAIVVTPQNYKDVMGKAAE